MLSSDQVLIQFGTNLVLCQVYDLIHEYLYQSVFKQFQCMEKYYLKEPIKLEVLISLALNNPQSEYAEGIHLPKNDLIELYTKKLIEKADILNDYYSI